MYTVECDLSSLPLDSARLLYRFSSPLLASHRRTRHYPHHQPQPPPLWLRKPPHSFHPPHFALRIIHPETSASFAPPILPLSVHQVPNTTARQASLQHLDSYRTDQSEEAEGYCSCDIGGACIFARRIAFSFLRTDSGSVLVRVWDLGLGRGDVALGYLGVNGGRREWLYMWAVRCEGSLVWHG